MKCMYSLKSKRRLTKATERELRGIVNGAFALSLAVGPKKTCEILKKAREGNSNVQ